MAQAFVQVGVDLIGKATVLAVGLFLGVVPSEFVQGVVRGFQGSLVVGMGDVGDGHRLGAEIAPDPVSVGEIDPYRSGRIGRAGECHGVHYLG